MQQHYDNDTALFDAYLAGTMSQADRVEMEQRLASEPELAQRLQLHQFTVAALRHAAQKDNNRFGQAMHGMSRTELQQLLASKRKRQPRQRRRRLVWVRWAASIAAVLVVGLVGIRLLWPRTTAPAQEPTPIMAATHIKAKPLAMKPGSKESDDTVEFPQYTQAEADLSNAIFAVRNGVDLENAAAVLQRHYDATHDRETGIYLAKAYMQLQEPDKAVEVAQDLERHFEGDAQVQSVLSDAQAALNS